MIAELLARYSKPESPLRAALVYELSGLSADGINEVKQSWPILPDDRKERLMTRLVEASEADSDLDFVELAKFAIHDEDSGVRRDAVNLLWTSDEPWVMDLLVDRAVNDVSTEVRAAAAGGLGRFVLLGELGDFPSKLATGAEATLLRILDHNQPTSEVYCRALESIAFSGRKEVPTLIRSAMDQPNLLLRAAAICAMGRSGDDQWGKSVLSALESQEPEIRFEAARAAGELELEEAVPFLIELYREKDREIMQAVIWAMGEIGGREAQQFLTALLSDESDDDLVNDIEDALTVASLSGVRLRSPDQSDA